MKTKEIAVSSLFAAVMCIMSPFSIPIGAIPVSLSVLAVFLTALCQKPKMALTSTLIYISIGSVGVPVFSGFTGGIQVLAGPTGGFIMAYPIMALLIAFCINKVKKKHRAVAKIASMLLSLAVCYTFGAFFFCVSTRQSVSYAISVCILPFIVFDLIKIAVAFVISIFFDKTKLSDMLSE